jgi:hypothetical protein
VGQSTGSWSKSDEQRFVAANTPKACDNIVCGMTNFAGDAWASSGGGIVNNVHDAGAATVKWARDNPGAIVTAVTLIATIGGCAAASAATAGVAALACAAAWGAAGGTIGDTVAQQLQHPGSMDFNELAVFTAGGALTAGTLGGPAAAEWGFGKQALFSGAGFISTQASSDLITDHRTSAVDYAEGTFLSSAGIGFSKGAGAVWSGLSSYMQHVWDTHSLFP